MPRLSASAAVRCASLRLWSVAYSQLWPDGLGQDPHDDRCVGGHARAGALCSDDPQTPCHICTGTGLTLASSALGLGSALLSHMRRDWAHCCHICTGTGLTLPHLPPGIDAA